MTVHIRELSPQERRFSTAFPTTHPSINSPSSSPKISLHRNPTKTREALQNRRVASVSVYVRSACETYTDFVPTPLADTLGYSPRPLKEYLEDIKTISNSLKDLKDGHHHKPFIISVTGSEEDVVECYKLITSHQKHVRMVLAMEVNLSCPNIPGKPPPAYSSASLLSYLTALKKEIGHQLEPLEQSHPHEGHIHVPIGIKTPPYTYHDQFQAMIDALLGSAKAEPAHLPCPVSFITATNTLGSSLLLEGISYEGEHPHETFERTINSANQTGVGGLAGAPLHPLALGNVYTIKGMLFQHDELQSVQIIGVGGVEDAEGYDRMRAVGAAAVGVGTALGRKGVEVFGEIWQRVQKK